MRTVAREESSRQETAVDARRSLLEIIERMAQFGQLLDIDVGAAPDGSPSGPTVESPPLGLRTRAAEINDALADLRLVLRGVHATAGRKDGSLVEVRALATSALELVTKIRDQFEVLRHELT